MHTAALTGFRANEDSTDLECHMAVPIAVQSDIPWIRNWMWANDGRTNILRHDNGPTVWNVITGTKVESLAVTLPESEGWQGNSGWIGLSADGLLVAIATRKAITVSRLPGWRIERDRKRLKSLVGATGFEPVTPCAQDGFQCLGESTELRRPQLIGIEPFAASLLRSVDA